ncbi:Hsp20/alpha crystallin family protein [Candidatus Dependentiae bacterium]|nr:Hsp20/alpha crystallin family protein [Candidatus Dependentiae bacterium]
MEKKLLVITITILLSSPAYAGQPVSKEEKTPWNFSAWLSEGFQKTMDRMEQEFEKLKQEFSKIKLFGPQVKTHEDKEKKQYNIEVKLSGYQKEKISIALDVPKGKEKQQIMTITASKEIIEKDPAGKKIETKEEKFEWSETLPKGANGQKATAQFKDGILLIQMPLEIKEQVETVTITVR